MVRRKPGALRNGAPFIEMPDAFRKLQDQMLRKPGGDREMVDILSLVLHHDEQAVLCAVEMALEAGVPTKTHVLNPAPQAAGWHPDRPAGCDAAGSFDAAQCARGQCCAI